MKLLLLILSLLSVMPGPALAQKEPHPCYLMGLFNADGTPNALGSLGTVGSNDVMLQDGKKIGDTGLPIPGGLVCLQNLSDRATMLRYVKGSSSDGAKSFMDTFRPGAKWVRLNGVGDEAAAFESPQQPGIGLIFRVREYAFILTDSKATGPEDYRKWALAVLSRLSKYKSRQ